MMLTNRSSLLAAFFAVASLAPIVTAGAAQQVRVASPAPADQEPSVAVPNLSATLLWRDMSFTMRAWSDSTWTARISAASEGETYRPVVVTIANGLPWFVRVHVAINKFIVIGSDGRQYESNPNPELDLSRLPSRYRRMVWDDTWIDIQSGASSDIVVVFDGDLPDMSLWRSVIYDSPMWNIPEPFAEGNLPIRQLTLR